MTGATAGASSTFTIPACLSTIGLPNASFFKTRRILSVTLYALQWNGGTPRLNRAEGCAPETLLNSGRLAT